MSVCREECGERFAAGEVQLQLGKMMELGEPAEDVAGAVDVVGAPAAVPGAGVGLLSVGEVGECGGKGGVDADD